MPAEQVAAKDNAAWVLEGDRGITFAQHAAARLDARRRTMVAGRLCRAAARLPRRRCRARARASRSATRSPSMSAGGALPRRSPTCATSTGRASASISFWCSRRSRSRPRRTRCCSRSPRPCARRSGAQRRLHPRTVARSWPAVIAIDVHAMLAQAKTSRRQGRPRGPGERALHHAGGGRRAGRRGRCRRPRTRAHQHDPEGPRRDAPAARARRPCWNSRRSASRPASRRSSLGNARRLGDPAVRDRHAVRAGAGPLAACWRCRCRSAVGSVRISSAIGACSTKPPGASCAACKPRRSTLTDL